MKKIFILLLFCLCFIFAIDEVYSEESLVKGADDFIPDSADFIGDVAKKHCKQLSLEQLAEAIRTKKLYDPKFFGLENYKFHTTYAALNWINSDYWFFIQSISRDANTKSFILLDNYKKQNIDFATERKSLATELIIKLGNFFYDSIDNQVDKTNPFFEYARKHGGMIPSRPMQMISSNFGSEEYEEEFRKDPEGSIKKTKQKTEKFRKELRDWLIHHEEFTIQDKLRKVQKEYIKTTCEYLVKLYSLEPRVDNELLELFSKSKYPETEKVKILMELKIPYKKFRRWESQDRKFQTNAQFISLDKNKSRVTLEKPNGKKTVVKLHILRFEDRKYITELEKKD